MFNVELQWKEFNISLTVVKDWLEANIETEFSGLSANSCLQIHFLEEPSQEEQDEILAYWDALTEESDEAEAYESAEEIEAARLVKAAAGKAKLLALGLTEEEIEAMLG